MDYILVTGEAGADHMPNANARPYQSSGVAIAQAKRRARARGPGAWWAVYYMGGVGIACGEIARPVQAELDKIYDAKIARALDNISGMERRANAVKARLSHLWRALRPRMIEVAIIAAGVLAGLCIFGLLIAVWVVSGGPAQ